MVKVIFEIEARILSQEEKISKKGETYWALELEQCFSENEHCEKIHAFTREAFKSLKKQKIFIKMNEFKGKISWEVL